MRNELIVGTIGTVVVVLLMIYFGWQYQARLGGLGGGSKIVGGAGGITLSLAEVSKHNNAGDCWVVISGKVYDVTRYANLHPGGAGAIDAYCGQDMTQAFLTKGGRGSHSSRADEQHAMMLLGSLGEQASSQGGGQR